MLMLGLPLDVVYTHTFMVLEMLTRPVGWWQTKSACGEGAWWGMGAWVVGWVG